MTGAPAAVGTPTAAGEKTLLFAVLMLAIGLNLRVPLGTVPAMLPDIERDLRLSPTGYGALTALTVVAMGVSAPLGPVLGRRLGAVRALTVMMLVLGLSGLLRVLAGAPVLFVCGILAGIGMGGTTAILPGLIARIAPRRSGTIIGLYSSSMALGVGLAAAVSHPLAELLGGWRASLAVWGVLATAVGLVWSSVASRTDAWFPPSVAPAAIGLPTHLPLRSASAWLVTLSVSTTMCVGMTCLAWLAPMGIDRGASEEDAANLLALFQLVQLGTMAGLPALADRSTDRRPMLALCQLCMLGGVVLLLPGSLTTTVTAVVLLAVGVGGATSLGLILIADVGGTSLGAARVGGLAFLCSFLVGAAAPGLLGLLLDRTGSYTPGLSVVAAPMLVALALGSRLRPGRTL